MFPKIFDFISTDPATPWMHYAVVLNGKLQATNNKMATYIDVSTFCKDEAQIKAIEGKVFNVDDLLDLSGIHPVELNSNGYIIMYDDGSNYSKEYTGTIGQNREISLYDDLMEEYVQEKSFKKFPDFFTIIPALTDDSIDVVKVQKRNTHFRAVGLAPAMLSTIAGAFQQKELHNSDFLRLEFFHAAKDKDKVDKVSASILVTPFKSPHPMYAEACIINPVF